MEVQLRDIPVGNRGEVAGYSKADRAYRDRLLAMGLTKGTPFTVVRVAPLGDPIELEVRGFRLSVRRAEADGLVVRSLA